MMRCSSVLLTANITTAANHKNMVGTWSGIVNFVSWNSEGGFYYTNNVLFIYLKFRTRTLLPVIFMVLKLTTITLPAVSLRTKESPSLCTRMLVSIEFSPRTVSGKKMSGTMQHFKPGQVDTGTFTFYKE